MQPCPRLRPFASLASLGLGLVLALGSACEVGGSGGGGGGGDGDGDGDGGGGGGGGGDGLALSGSIAEDLSITGTASLDAAATVEAGVTVTFAAGSSLAAAAGATLTVRGTLLVEGTAEAPVVLEPAAGATSWTGVVVEAGGAATLTYATGSRVSTLMQCKSGAAACVLERVDFSDLGKVMLTAAPSILKASTILDMAGGGVVTQPGADLTVVDSVLYNAGGDIIVAAGGSLTVEYSTVGAAVGGYDHCNFHIGQADAVTIRYNDIPDGVFAFMIGGVTGATITHNNFSGNGVDIDEVGAVVDADFSQNHWASGAPTFTPGVDLAPYDVSNASATPIAEAGPRI